MCTSRRLDDSTASSSSLTHQLTTRLVSRDDVRDDAFARKSGKDGAKKYVPPPKSYVNPCCQICPTSFASLLEKSEYTEEKRQLIYRKFYKWHSFHYDRGAAARERHARETFRFGKENVPARSQPFSSLDSFLEVEPKPMMFPGSEPCCALCPGGFDQVERMATANMKSGVTVFLETETRAREEPKDFCCKVCAAQFYPPREYFDYESIVDAEMDSFVEVDERAYKKVDSTDSVANDEIALIDAFDAKAGTGAKSGGADSSKLSCCVACSKNMFGGVSKSEEEIEAAADAKGGGGAKGGAAKGLQNKRSGPMTDPAPRNPENLRNYANDKKGGAK